MATRDERKAFWINIYNVLVIHGLVAYEVEKSVQEIHGTFERMAYVIGGLRYSLADIEHGILRSNRAHHGIRRSHRTHHIVPGVRFSKRDPRIRHVLQEHDPRIHFAIVCGSNSCPPVGIYQSNVRDEQLNLAAKNFLNSDAVTLNRSEMSVSLARISKWYSSDFGGSWATLGNQAHVLRYISSFLLDAEDKEFILTLAKDLKIEYQEWDWSLNA